MSEIYKLPGSSYEELIKIIRAYAATSKNGAAVSLAEVAQSTGMNRTIISRNNGFLTQIKLVSEGNKKIPTDLCMNLGRAYQLNIEDEIAETWNHIITNDEFLRRMISVVQIKGEIAKGDFINHIVYSSSNNNSNNTRAGAAAIIEILKIAKKIEEYDDRIKVGTGIVKKKVHVEPTVYSEEKTQVETEMRSEESVNRIVIPETGYYVQTYTCESGKAAKFVIPEDATEDDLLAFYDMLNIILKRKFKIKTME